MTLLIYYAILDYTGGGWWWYFIGLGAWVCHMIYHG
jgi:hypothetical protein